MRMIILPLLLLSAAALTPGQAVAADLDANEDCRDDQGTNRCAPVAQKKMRDAYRLDDAETMMKAGATVRRAMYVDGYGRDVVAISFVRKPGGSPYVDIRSPCADGKDCSGPLTANISSRMWDKVIGQSKSFDQKLAREMQAEAAGKEQTLRVCLHSWVVVAEAVDAAEIDQSLSGQSMTKGNLRRDTEDACTDGLTIPFTFELAEMALESLPECSGLNASSFRNIPTLLSTCSRLGGDRLAAADAYAFVEKLRDIDRDGQTEFGAFFTLEGKARSTDFSRDLGKGQIYLGAPNATDLNNATVKGEVVYFGPKGEDNTGAPVELKLVREFGGFKIVDYSIGERKPLRN